MENFDKIPKLILNQDWIAAERLLKKAAQSKNASPDVFYNLAKVLEARNKYRQCGVWFRKAVNARRDYQIAWFELGRWSVSYGMLRSAFEAFENAYILDSKDKDAAINLARVALRLGKWEIAGRLWEQFDDQEAKQAMYRICVESGEDGIQTLKNLLSQKSIRAEVIKTMTRTAKGRIPLKF